MAGFDSLPQL
jgi:hypothetical protein